MKKISTYEMATCAIMAALMCVLGPMSIPIGPIPISLTILVILLAVVLLGTKGACVSLIVYILLGAVGLPVFSGFSGGLAKLAGPTGGYIIGFIFMVIISGIVYKKTNSNPIFTYIGMLVGIAADYVFGTIWFIQITESELAYALSVCVYPFVIWDALKALIALALGLTVKRALTKAGLIEAR